MDLSERGASGHRHPWETARAAFFIDLLRRRHLLDGPRTWLDVGAGDGWLTGELAQSGDFGSSYTCWDINYSEEDLGDRSARGDPRISFDSSQPDRVFDVLLLLDVIEHVDDDRSFLSALASDRLSPGGTALISVPAWQSLFSRHDVALKHHRRYSPSQARNVIRSAGLTVVEQGGLFHSLLAPRAAQVAIEHLGRPAPTQGIGAWSGGSRLTATIDTILRVDGRLSRTLSQRGRVLPGLSYWALCTRA